MKKLPLILNLVLLFAVVLLYILFFKSKSHCSNEVADKPVVKFDSAYAGKIAMVYVNIDSILTNYKLAVDLNDQLIKKQKISKNNLESQAASFEKEAAAFQEKVQKGAFLSQQSAEAQQQELQKKQAYLYQLENDLTMELSKEQANLNKQLFDSITNYLEQFNKTRHYNFILGHTNGGGLLYADKKLDITAEVLKELNERYAATKKN